MLVKYLNTKINPIEAQLTLCIDRISSHNFSITDPWSKSEFNFGNAIVSKVTGTLNGVAHTWRVPVGVVGRETLGVTFGVDCEEPVRLKWREVTGKEWREFAGVEYREPKGVE